MKPKGYLQVERLSKQFDGRIVLDEIELEIKKGEFVAIVGKSGCGKSTLLRLIAGLDDASSGTIKIKGGPLAGINKNARIMFQDGRLLPWLKILDNVGLGLTGDWQEAARKALKSVGLEDRANDWPSKLSGGQKQRVALARALVHQPELLLLDEPLGALDALTRIEMQDLVETLWHTNGFTSILVTHDVEEAVSLADRVILIEDGKIVMDRHIDLPRPRQRAQAAFNTYVDDILQRILKANYPNLKVVKKY